jgi:hypothetical protein
MITKSQILEVLKKYSKFHVIDFMDYRKIASELESLQEDEPKNKQCEGCDEPIPCDLQCLQEDKDGKITPQEFKPMPDTECGIYMADDDK